MRIDIAHLAGLAKLRFTPGEIEKFESEMQNIVEMVSTLPALDETAKLLDAQNPMILRSDVVMPSTSRERILGNAPAIQAGCIVVPKTVE